MNINATMDKRAALEVSVTKLNEAILANSAHEVIEKQMLAIAEDAKTLNKSLVTDEFMTLRDSDKPMYNAIYKLEVPVVRVKETDEKWIVEEGTKVIDLVALERFCKPADIANKPGWSYRAENVARLIAARATKDIGGDYKDLLNNYRLTKKADRTQEACPISNSQLTKLLQDFVDMILFEDNGQGLNAYKVTSQDVAFILYTACKPGKAPKTVTMPQAKTIINLTTQVINRIITGDSYKSLYRRNED
jgi:hypothetical protein